MTKHAKVRDQILDDLKKGVLGIGQKLPPEREMAERLGVSRNTVATAYNDLVKEGVLIAHQGRGTFVSEDVKTWRQHALIHRLHRIIDLAQEEAWEMGISAEGFLSMVEERVREKENRMHHVQAVCLECNSEQAKIFARELDQETPFTVTPATLDQLKGKDQQLMERLAKTQVVITAFNHLAEVRELLQETGIEIMGIATTPDLESIVKLARYPEGTTFGLITFSREYGRKVEQALHGAGMKQLKILSTVEQEGKELKKVMDEADVLVVSPARMEDVAEKAKGSKELIQFSYRLDTDSAKTIVARIMEMK